MEALSTTLKAAMVKLTELDTQVFDLKMQNALLKEEIEQLKGTHKTQVTTNAFSWTSIGVRDDKTTVNRPERSEGGGLTFDPLQAQLVSLQEQVQTLQEKQAESDRKIVSLCEENEAVRERQDTTEKRLVILDRLQLCLNRAMVDMSTRREADVQARQAIPEVKNRLAVLEQTIGASAQPAVFHVKLNISSCVTRSHTFQKLNKCIDVHSNTASLFDTKSCVFMSDRDGVCVVSAQICQKRDGGIDLQVYHNDKSYYMSGTSSALGTATGLYILHLQKGDKVWWASKRWTGDCYLGYCEVIGWFLA